MDNPANCRANTCTNRLDAGGETAGTHTLCDKNKPLFQQWGRRKPCDGASRGRELQGDREAGVVALGTLTESRLSVLQKPPSSHAAGATLQRLSGGELGGGLVKYGDPAGQLQATRQPPRL